MTFKRIRKDEYVFDDSVIRMTKEKEKKIKQLDKIHFNDRRFA